jgi:PPOX class probable F420-dependent enzyme
MTTEVPQSHADLLERPLFAHLATLRPDGSPQSSVMWFAWDGQRARFSHTSTRQKYRNLVKDGRVSFHIQDPENPYRTLEVRGRVESMTSDPDAVFYQSLQQRYGMDVPVFDADVRVVIVVEPTNYVAVDGGLTPSETTALTELLSNLSPAGAARDAGLDEAIEESFPASDPESSWSGVSEPNLIEKPTIDSQSTNRI